jgi:sugar phosphate isomerase/epimerase
MVSHRRRDFLAGLVAAEACNSMAKAEVRSKPKIGCCSTCFHGSAPGASPEGAIETIGGLGFDGVELLIGDPKDIQGYWTGATLDRLQKLLERWRLQVPELGLYRRLVQDLTSPDAGVRARCLEYFEAGCKIARKLGAPIICVSSQWAHELSCPMEALAGYYELSDPKPGEKFHIRIAPPFDWDDVWQRYIQITRQCLARAKSHGLLLAIEPHTNTIVHDATAFLRLWDAIRDPSLGCNLDVGFVARNREYPPVAIHQLKKRLINLHIRDIDGRMSNFMNFGEGVTDVKAIADALKAVGFERYVTIEQSNDPATKESCRRYLQTMREYLA